ncbi:MipA/OmpV family protein [Pseudomonas sp. TMP9]|uniref:MipA/OmpV family protein n=1 Tax=Pseudomonas sp. TMP9 TaxID=3133144 RepID=UPI0030D0B40D
MNAKANKWIFSGLILVTLSAASQAQTTPPAGATSDWTLSAGAAVGVYPLYVGSSKSKTLAIPTFDIRYRDWFFINPIRGIGAEVELLEGLKASASLGASLNARKTKDDSRLNGLGDIGSAPTIRLGMEYKLGKAFVGGTVISRLGSSNGRGTQLEVDAGYTVLASRAGIVALGLEVKAMDNTYARNFFGVSAQQSAASGLATFNANGGLQSIGPFVQAIVPLSDAWTLFGRASFNQLRNDAATSPITEDRGQPSVLATLNYKF